MKVQVISKGIFRGTFIAFKLLIVKRMKVNESGLQLKVRKNAISLNSAGKKNYKMQMISVS